MSYVVGAARRANSLHATVTTDQRTGYQYQSILEILSMHLCTNHTTMLNAIANGLRY